MTGSRKSQQVPQSEDGDRPRDPPPEKEGVEVNRASVALGARWSLISLVAKQASRILFSLLLARLLGPENFGIIAVATIYLAFSLVFLDVGLAASLIQRRRVDREVTGTATWVNLGVLSVLVAVTQIAADVWADFFHTPELGAVLRVLSLTYVFNGLGVVPGAMLVRRLEFKLLGIAEVASSLFGGVAGVVAAVAGAEYWALVIQTLTRDAVMLVIVLRVTGPPVLAWSRVALSEISSFSRNAFGSQLLGFAGQNADNFLIGWRLGAVSLAHYALSYRMLLLPVLILGQTANRLVFPIFSRLNDDRTRQARYFVKTTSSLAVIVVPAMGLVALGAPRGVPIVFGEDWVAAIRPMQVLAGASVLRVLVTVASAVMFARGKATWVFRVNLVAIPAHIAGFTIGLRWGIDGVAWSYLLIGIPMAGIYLTLLGRLIPITISQYAAATLPAVTGTLAMALAWTATERVLAGGVASPLVLLVSASTSILAFVACVLTFWRQAIHEQVRLFRLLVGRSLPDDGTTATVP